jgi:predicted DNA-binding protein
MEVTTVRFPKQLRERLKIESQRSGVKPAEIIRRAVDDHLAKQYERWLLSDRDRSAAAG